MFVLALAIYTGSSNELLIFIILLLHYFNRLVYDRLIALTNNDIVLIGKLEK